MTSREIAELTGKNHADVLRDIRNMLAALSLGESSFAGSYLSAQNKVMPEYRLPKDLTLTLISGYSIPMRHKIVVRCQELEAQVVTLGAHGAGKDMRLTVSWESCATQPSSSMPMRNL